MHFLFTLFVASVHVVLLYANGKGEAGVNAIDNPK